MLRVPLRDQIRNEKLRRRTGIEDVIVSIANLKWRCVRHEARQAKKQRMDKESCRLEPPIRWTEDIKITATKWTSNGLITIMNKICKCYCCIK